MLSSLFICHGAPLLAIQDNEYTQFVQDLGRRFNPKAIVIFTAHWESSVPTISYHDKVYDTIYDFGGFSPELFQITYPAKGSTAVAEMVEQRFKSLGIDSLRDYQRGLDHGSWVVLRLLYPNANIPVVQISVNPFLPAKEQFKIGEALRGLSQEDILVVGSGGTSHNLRSIKWDQSEPEAWTVAFDDWIIDKLQARDLESLFNYEELAPYAQIAVPRAEHFVPLFITLGSGDVTKQPTLLHRSYDYGTLSHIVFEF